MLLDEANGLIYVSDACDADGDGNADPSGRVISYPLHAGSTISLGTPTGVTGTGNTIANGQPFPSQLS